MSRAKKMVLREDPDYDPEEGCCMEFRLTYQGPLFASQHRLYKEQRDKRAPHKHAIRRVFHRQLREFWRSCPAIKPQGPQHVVLTERQVDESELPSYDIEILAKRHARYGFNFVPLVTPAARVICGLDVLFLRRGAPGGVLNSGDIDNRLKTLFDALCIPSDGENYSSMEVAEDEKPFFCLLQDDRLITKVAVETDQLLEDVTDQPSENDVRLVITVRLRPYEVNMWNLRFA